MNQRYLYKIYLNRKYTLIYYNNLAYSGKGNYIKNIGK